MSAAHRTHLLFYRKLLAHARDRNCWIASAGEIADWWVKQGY
jgi:hypothetical protein